MRNRETASQLTKTVAGSRQFAVAPQWWMVNRWYRVWSWCGRNPTRWTPLNGIRLWPRLSAISRYRWPNRRKQVLLRSARTTSGTVNVFPRRSPIASIPVTAKVHARRSAGGLNTVAANVARPKGRRAADAVRLNGETKKAGDVYRRLLCRLSERLVCEQRQGKQRA